MSCSGVAAMNDRSTFTDAAGVARLLGLPDAAAFLRRRDRLEDEDLFPLPMPTSRRPLLWKRDEVQAWVDIRGLPRLAPAGDTIDPALIQSGKVSLLPLARA